MKMSKCEFGKTYLVYLGYIVGGGKLQIYPSKVEVIVNCLKPNNVTEVRSVLGESHYWRKFIANFSFVASPLRALTDVNKVFQWEGKSHKSFNSLKEKIITAPILSLSDLQQQFGIETDADGYPMGAVLMQHKNTICYHSKTFSNVVINYPTYDK